MLFSALPWIDVDHLAPDRRLGRRPVPVARDVEAGEDRVIGELVGERPPLLLEYVRDHNVRALGDEAAREAGTHSTGAARDNHCPIIETFHELLLSSQDDPQAPHPLRNARKRGLRRDRSGHLTQIAFAALLHCIPFIRAPITSSAME